jgi:hypothetical protein
MFAATMTTTTAASIAADEIMAGGATIHPSRVVRALFADDFNARRELGRCTEHGRELR